MEIEDSRLEKGFKVSYSKIRKAVLSCELDKKKDECKKIFKELNIEVFDD